MVVVGVQPVDDAKYGRRLVNEIRELVGTAGGEGGGGGGGYASSSSASRPMDLVPPATGSKLPSSYHWLTVFCSTSTFLSSVWPQPHFQAFTTHMLNKSVFFSRGCSRILLVFSYIVYCVRDNERQTISFQYFITAKWWVWHPIYSYDIHVFVDPLFRHFLNLSHSR